MECARRRHFPGALALTAFVVAAPAGCDGSRAKDPAGAPEEALPVFTAQVRVVSEDGAPIAAATYAVDAAPGGSPVDAGGRFRLRGLTGPVLVVIEAPGHLPEPIVLDGTAAAAPGGTEVRLLRRSGPAGRRRIALHFGGDVMLGRRYLEPTSDVTARVTRGDGGTSARTVASALAPLFRAADLRSLNFESVLGDLPPATAYPKKRFLLLSPPEALSLLDELGASLVTLGNNHARDWLDPGIAATVSLLAGAGIPNVGAAVEEGAAAAVLAVEAAGFQVGFLSYTSVNGDFVNDSLPGDADPAPDPLDPEEVWQYEMRRFGYTGGGILIPEAPRRIGESWRLFRQAEDEAADPAAVVDLWAQAAAVYPELQDWVARRGHGGANGYTSATIAADVGRLRADGCELVVVQFHGGFQFFEFKSEHLERSAHQAIDAGADLVVAHHPHVLQGFEWYRGKLIAYSLGNLVFDQDFLATFPTAVLRVVFEEDDLLAAKVYPAVIERYRPLPLSGTASRHVIQALHERSALPLRSERLDGAIRNVLRPSPAGAVPARLELEGAGARIEIGPAPVVLAVALPGASGVAALAPPALTRSRGPGGGSVGDLLLGRDLLRWGSFEDETADGEARGGHHWLVNDTFKRVEVLAGAPSGSRCLRLHRSAANSARTSVRPVARIPLTRNRMHGESGGAVAPMDGSPSYSLRFQARLSGRGLPFVRLDFYHFDDANPTEDPESIPLRSREIALPITPGAAWVEHVVDIPSEALAAVGGLEANAVLLNLGLAPPPAGESVLRLDDIQFLEWRPADSLPDGFYALDLVRFGHAAPAAAVLERTAE